MPMITMGEGRKAWVIKYSKKEIEGFYFVADYMDIIDNCRTLGIGLPDEEASGNKYTFENFESFFVLTFKAFAKHKQYIVHDSASEGDKLEFAQKLPKKTAEKIYQRLGLELESNVFINLAKEDKRK